MLRDKLNKIQIYLWRKMRKGCKSTQSWVLCSKKWRQSRLKLIYRDIWITLKILIMSILPNKKKWVWEKKRIIWRDLINKRNWKSLKWNDKWKCSRFKPNILVSKQKETWEKLVLTIKLKRILLLITHWRIRSTWKQALVVLK